MVHPREDEQVKDVLAAEEFGVPAPDPVFRLRSEPVSDVLAAEEFGVPAADPAFVIQVGPATDVLAAEEFAMPAPDPALRPEDLLLPADLVGGEARDILVAEEFAIPAPDEARVHRRSVLRRGLPVVRWLALALPPLATGAYLLRRRRRRREELRRSRVRRLLFRR